MDDSGRLFAKFRAAIYLYELTGNTSYRNFVESNYQLILSSYGPTQWDTEKQEALLYYTRLTGITNVVKSAILISLLGTSPKR